VEQHHHVEAVLDGPAVAGLLVAAVAEVALVLDHRDGERRGVAEPQPDLVGVVLAGVVADHDVVNRLGEGLGEPGQRALEGRGSVVGDDQDPDTGRARRVGRGSRHLGSRLHGSPSRAPDGPSTVTSASRTGRV
jgi:hypothetical protein